MQTQQMSSSRATRTTLRRATVAPRAFLGMLNPAKERVEKKKKLLSLIEPLDRGIAAGPEDLQAVEKAVQALERINPTSRPIKSDLVNGKWELLFTTNTNILGGNRPAMFRPSGAFYQYIDTANLKARNQETHPYFNEIDAELTPVSDSRVDVKFKKLILLGLIPVNAPEFMKGWLEMTYVDEDIRISRGDLGNLFVLRRV